MALPDHYATLGIQRTAKLHIGLEDSCLGAKRMFSIRMHTADATGHATLQNWQFELSIPKGIREGQSLRLSGLGDAGQGGAPAGDLYAVRGIMLPLAASEPDQEAYSALARAFASFQPRVAGLG